MVQVQVCWYKGQRHKTTTVKHHGSDNQGLFPCLPALQKGSQFEQTPQSLDLLKVPCKKYLTSPMIKKNSPKLLCSKFLTYAEWVYCPSSWCKFGRRTLVSAVAKTWPPNRWPEPLNKVTRWTIWCHASHGKSPEAEKHHHEDTWLWLKNDSPLRIQNDTYYDIWYMPY